MVSSDLGKLEVRRQRRTGAVSAIAGAATTAVAPATPAEARNLRRFSLGTAAPQSRTGADYRRRFSGRRGCRQAGIGEELEADGVVLTPEELMKRFPECKLLDETPSLELNSIMLNCEGDIGQVFIFTKTKETCEGLAKE